MLFVPGAKVKYKSNSPRSIQEGRSMCWLTGTVVEHTTFMKDVVAVLPDYRNPESELFDPDSDANEVAMVPIVNVVFTG